MADTMLAPAARIDQADLLHDLLEISVNLSATRDRRKMLEMIVSEARRMTAAEAGSLYVRRGKDLQFVVAQNDALDPQHMSGALAGRKVVVGSDSLAGFVASTGRIIRIPDCYRLSPGAPFRINREFDATTGYRTCSVLAIPLKTPDGQTVGVLQLINRRSGGRVAPFPEEQDPVILALASMAAVSLHNALLVDELKQAHLDSIIRLSVVAEFRDRATADHIQRISELSAMLARALRLDTAQVELIQCASPMHDIGKIGIPDAILLKPGPLTGQERSIVETHTLIGAEILGQADNDLLNMARDIALSHHERWDGAGYPHRLAGTKIPLPGRIVCLADVFDALVTPRCYKAAYPIEKVVEIVRREDGRHFDPRVTAALFDVMDDVMTVYTRAGQSFSETPRDCAEALRCLPQVSETPGPAPGGISLVRPDTGATIAPCGSSSAAAPRSPFLRSAP